MVYMVLIQKFYWKFGGLDPNKKLVIVVRFIVSWNQGKYLLGVFYFENALRVPRPDNS
jgi:hypothetical protein